MESGAQVAGGVNIYPKNFQKRINAICKKYNVLFVLDEIICKAFYKNKF